MSDHIALAKELFNEAWDLMDKAGRSAEDDIAMLHKAHTSCYLWREAGSPVNNARGEWQVSRVYSMLNMGAPALLHGKYSLALCLENGIGGFDLAFGHEAAARAYRVLGDMEKAARHKALGLAACDGIGDEGDREYTKSNFNDL